MLQKDNRTKIIQLFLDKPEEAFQLREISRLTNIAPPSVKKYLQELITQNLIKKTIPKTNYPQYQANRNANFKTLKLLHTLENIQELATYLEDTTQPDVIILFGSAAKGEDLEDSDIDIFIQTEEQPKNLNKFESKLNKKINILKEDFNKLSNELKNNIANGIKLRGYLKIWD